MHAIFAPAEAERFDRKQFLRRMRETGFLGRYLPEISGDWIVFHNFTPQEAHD